MTSIDGATDPQIQRDCDLMLDLFGIWDAAGTSEATYSHPALDIPDRRHVVANAALIKAGLIDPGWGAAEDDTPVLTDAGRAYLARRCTEGDSRA